MSLSCINVKSKEFLDLQKKSGLYTHELEFMVARWQEINNQLDIFPNLSQLQPEVFYSKVTNSSEAIIASEKTIRDLAARMADRIGMKVVFEADQTKEYKGRIDYQPKGFGTRDEDYNASETVAIINLAHATLDTPIHEILGHPIIRAIKNKQQEDGKNITKEEFEKETKNNTPSYSSDTISEFIIDNYIYRKVGNEYTKGRDIEKPSELYQNLLKELETGRGKEVLDRIKRDYQFKDVFVEPYYGGDGSDYDSFRKRNPGQYKTSTTPYTLEEQQEEAIVELLGLMTAEKLDKVKDGKLISLLKRLLKEMKQFVRSLINQKEVEIDKLPDNMTIGDLADILAYSNSKLILPGHEVVYTTPDNNKFKTYSEASKHISELSKSIKNVDLDNVGLLKEKPIYKIGDYFGQYEKGFVEEKGLNKIESQEEADYLNSQEYRIEEPTTIRDFIEKNKEYEQSKEIIEEWKKVNNIQYNPEEIYSRGQEFSSVVGAYSEFDVNLMMQNLLSHIEDNEKANNHNKITSKDKIVFGHPTIGKSFLKNQGDNKFISLDDDYSTEINIKVRNIADKYKVTPYQVKDGGNAKWNNDYNTMMQQMFNIAKQKAISENKTLFTSNTNLLKNNIESFDKVINLTDEEFNKRIQERGAKYDVKEWKQQINDVISKIPSNKVILTDKYLSDLFSKGSGFAISAYTKPIDKQIGHLEGGGGKIKFKLYPQSQDILWAANTDVYSGSVWDASEKVNKDKKSELLGVSYTKYPSLRSINTVQPNLANIVDNLNYHHNELGIVLTGNNFRLEYDEDIPYQTKKIIDGINKILDQKYGKLVKPEISKKEKSNNLVYNVNFSSAGGEISANKNFSSLKEATDYIESIKEDLIGFGVGKVIPQKIYTQSGIQPTQTNENTKSISMVMGTMDLGKIEGTPDFVDAEITKEEYESNIKSRTEDTFTGLAKDIEPFREHAIFEGSQYRYYDKEGNPYFKNVKADNTFRYSKRRLKKNKEFTSQALINTKIAALKEIGKRYPRSLIRSEVKPIYMSDGISRLEFDPDELPFQKLSKVVSINPAITQFKNEIKLKKKEVSGLQKAIINKRVALANAKLGSSYYINYTQVGQSDNYTWEIVDKAQGQMRIAMSVEESRESQDDKLNKILLDFLAQFGISGEQVSKIASVRGYSPLAIADFTNKLIQWTKGNEKEIPEEAAHFILGMMPRNDLFARLMKLARKSDKFSEVNEVYSEIYNDEDKVVFETAGKLLADAFNNKFEQEGESFLSRTLRLVLNWVRQLFGKAQLSSLKEELEKEFGALARGIMEGTVTDLSTANLGQGVYYSTEEAVKKTVESLKNRKAYLSKFTGGQDAETVKIRRSKLDADIKRLEKDASEETLINLGYKHLKESEKILNKKNFTPKDLNDVQLTISRLKALPQLFKKEELVLTNEQSAKVKNLADEILNLEKLWKQKMLQVGVAEARAQGYDLTEDELMQAVADIGWFKREELSIDTSHIPIMKVIYSIITEMKRERDAEYEAYKAQSDEFRKTKSFDHLLDSKGRLITQTKSEFFEEEAKEFRKLNAYLEKYKGNKKKIYEAYTRMHNWYRDNVNYELTQEGLDLYNAAYEQRRAELINDDGTWDDENLEELNKWELDYNPNTGIAFANHTSGFVSGNNHWFTFLKQTPKKEWKNSEYDRVKDDPLYQFIIKSVKEAEEMVPHQMLIDVGNFDKVLHDMFFDLTNTDRTSFNALKKGVGDWLDNTFKTILTADDLEGTGKDIKDELGNTIDVVNAPSKTHLKGKNLLDIVDGFYSLALTYKHKEAVSPTVRVLYELLKVQDAVEINKAGKRVKKGDSVQLKPAGLHNAVDATYYHMQSELYNQIRLDNENINPTAKEEKEFKDALTQWEIERDLALKEGREVPPKPILKKVSAVKAVDALIDYTRILKLGLKPSSAITNLLVGFTSNYLYAARNKEFSDKHLNKATRLLLNNVARALTGKKVSNEIGEKIANLSIKMGIQNAVMEDQFKYQDKFSQFMFSMQTSGEFLIANQLMLAMMFKQTVVNLKGETKELFDAYDKNGEWNTKEFGTQPKWTDDKYKEDGLNTSEIRKFRNKFEELRKNRQGDYQSFIKGKSKVVGRVYHLFRTWLPRMVYQRFGQEQGDFKGRYKSYAAAWDKYREHPSKKFGGFLVNTLGVVLAKTVNIPILNKLGLNSLSELASEKYEMSLKEAGLSDLDIENMRENVRELQFIVYIILFTLILKSLAEDDDDKTLNYLINLNQRMYQDLTFFYVPTSTFSILRDILPVVSTLEDATEVVMQSTNFLETYESGFRKGDNKLLKEIGDVTPLWSSVNSTMSMLNSQFTGSSYKAK